MKFAVGVCNAHRITAKQRGHLQHVGQQEVDLEETSLSVPGGERQQASAYQHLRRRPLAVRIEHGRCIAVDHADGVVREEEEQSGRLVDEQRWRGHSRRSPLKMRRRSFFFRLK